MFQGLFIKFDMTNFYKLTIDNNLFIAVTRCCAGIPGISCCITASDIPLALVLHSSQILSSKSTAPTASCFITTSATAILDADSCWGLVTDVRFRADERPNDLQRNLLKNLHSPLLLLFNFGLAGFHKHVNWKGVWITENLCLGCQSPF